MSTVVVGALLIAPGIARAEPARGPAQAAPAVATAAPAPSLAKARAEARTRYQIFVMEAVLQRAVDHGAEILSERIRQVMPNMVVLAGTAQARGFQLPDYGIFFDVEVPALRRSVAWSFQMLDQPDPTLSDALAALKQHVQAIGDSNVRRSLESALQQVESQMGPLLPSPPRSLTPAAVSAGQLPGGPVAAATTTAASTASPARAAREAADRALLQNPEAAYLKEVKKALIEAMLDYGGPLAIRPNEWLTVAARDDEGPTRLLPGQPIDVRSMTLRIRGRDLDAFRAGRLTRAQAIKRIEVLEY